MLHPKPLSARAAERNPQTIRTTWPFLNEIDQEDLLGHGPVYGGGLHQVEPESPTRKELSGFMVL